MAGHPIAPPFPDPALILMVGPSGSGKSTWAEARYRPQEIVSSDELRSRLGSGPADLDVSAEAFDLVSRIATTRVTRRLTTVVDTLGFDQSLRSMLLERARSAGVVAHAVVFTTPAAVCRERNRRRTRSVPAQVLTGQIRHMAEMCVRLVEEGWSVVEVDTSEERGGDQADAAPTSVASPPSLAFHLQVSRFPPDTDLGTWVDGIARLAESVGFEGISVMDHLIQIPQVGREWEPMPEAMAVMGRIAGASSSLRVGALVSPVTFRHPAVLARHLATLDVLTGGRVDCGLGAGWFGAEHDALGIPFPPVGQRMAELEDAARLLPLIWGAGSPGFEGETVSVPKAVGYPRPPNGHIPVIVGGGGARTLRIAVAHADGWNVRSEVFEEKASEVQRHCEDLGREPRDLMNTILDVTVVGQDRAEVADRIEGIRGRRDAATVAASHNAGVPDRHINRYGRLAELGVDRVYVALRGPDLPRSVEAFAEVIAAFR